MKNRLITFSRYLPGCLCFVAALGVGMQALAEVKTKAYAAVPDSAKELASVDARVMSNLAPGVVNLVKEESNLRCWQDGTLLFEETNLSERSLENAKQVLVFDFDSEQAGGEVFLIESGSATCLYKKV